MPNNIPVFLSSDNNYAPFVTTTIASVCNHTKSFVDFYVLDGGISEENKEKICELKKVFNNFSIEFIKIDVEKYFPDFKENMHFSKSMYSRFLIPELKPDIDKALYSDVDVIVLDDIKKMYDEDLEGHVIGAVYEEINGKPMNPKKQEVLPISTEHCFFSSGNLLIDCQIWRQKDFFKRLMELQNKYKSILEMPDQDLLNICFDNNYKKLDQKYCYLTAYAYCCPTTDIVIRHFEGLLKPWNIAPDSDIDLPHLQDFWSYASKTPFYPELLKRTEDKNLQAKMRRLSVVQKILMKGMLK